MNPKIKGIYTAQYAFLLAAHIFSYIFFAFMLDAANSQPPKRKYPGIDIKDFK
jgi:hypothetical protein